MFECFGCSKPYVRYKNCTNHQEKSIDCHIGEFRCPHCTQYYRSRYYLNIHQRGKHPLQFLGTLSNTTRDILNNKAHYLYTGPHEGQVFPEQQPHHQQMHAWNTPQQWHSQQSTKSEHIAEQPPTDEKMDISVCIAQRSHTSPAKERSLAANEIIDLLSQESPGNLKNLSDRQYQGKANIKELLVLDHNDNVFKTYQLRNKNREIVDVPVFLERITDIVQHCLLDCLRTHELLKFNIELHLELVRLNGEDMNMSQQSYATEYVKLNRGDDWLLYWQVEKELLILKSRTELEAAEDTAIYEIKYLELNIGSGHELPSIRVATNLF